MTLLNSDICVQLLRMTDDTASEVLDIESGGMLELLVEKLSGWTSILLGIEIVKTVEDFDEQNGFWRKAVVTVLFGLGSKSFLIFESVPSSYSQRFQRSRAWVWSSC